MEPDTEQKARHYSRGSIIIEPGDPVEGIYQIRQGFIKGYSLGSQGEQALHFITKPGDFVPLRYALSQSPSELYYEALDDVELVSITPSQQEKLFGSPHFLTLVAKNWAYDVERMRILGLSTGAQRVAAKLVFWVKVFGRRVGEGAEIKLPVTQEDFARSINLTRESAAREIAQLKIKGLISWGHGLIKITDMDKLKRLMSLGVLSVSEVTLPTGLM